jgi:hypothetical protein
LHKLYFSDDYSLQPKNVSSIIIQEFCTIILFHYIGKDITRSFGVKTFGSWDWYWYWDWDWDWDWVWVWDWDWDWDWD